MSPTSTFRFRLYVAGQSHNSVLALENLRALCRQHLRDRHEIEVVDVLRQADRALADGILVTPTLLKLSPAPTCRIMGSLALADVVLATLGLAK